MIQKVKNKILELKSSEYVRNVATLASGTTIAQLISLASAPILYRIYSKEDYGTLGTYMAVSAVVGVFSTLRYNEAIMLEEDETDAKAVLWLNRYLNLIFTVIIFIIFLFASNLISENLENTNLKKWLIFVPVSVFFSTNNNIFRVWANRNSEYKVLTLNSILVALVIPLFSIIYGLINPNESGLIISFILGQIVPFIILYYSLSKKYSLGFNTDTSFDKLLLLAKRYKNFPKYSLIPDFLFSFNSQLPIFFLASNIGSSAVGVYNLAMRVLTIPVQLISKSISEVFRQRAIIEYQSKGNCISIYKKTFFYLFSIAIIPFGILVFWAPDLFAFFFGENWRESGRFSQILTPLVFANFIVSPLTYLYYIANKQLEDTVTYMIFFGFNLVIFYLLPYKINEILSIYVGFSVLFYVINFVRSYRFSKGN